MPPAVANPPLWIDTRRLAFHTRRGAEPDTPPSPEALDGSWHGSLRAGRTAAAGTPTESRLVPVVSPRLGLSSPFSTPRFGPRDLTFDGMNDCGRSPGRHHVVAAPSRRTFSFARGARRRPEAARRERAAPRAGLVTRAVAPFIVVDANAHWLAMMGHRRGDVVGKTLRAIQGPRTDGATVKSIHTATEGARKSSFELINYKADGTAFLNRLRISPVWSGGRGEGALWPDLYLGLFEDLGRPGGRASPVHPAPHVSVDDFKPPRADSDSGSTESW